jgi:hypothetical protein
MVWEAIRCSSAITTRRVLTYGLTSMPHSFSTARAKPRVLPMAAQ